MVKPIDLIFFTRPVLLIPAWTVYLHYVATCHSQGFIRIDPGGDVGVHLIILTLLIGAAYVINQIFDIESDRRNDKLYFLPRRIITIRSAWLYYFVLTAAGLLMTVLVQPHIFAGSLALVLLGIVYSAPGIRLKDRPVAGLLNNAAAFGLVIPWMAAWICLSGNVTTAALPYFFAIAAGYVLTTIPDRPGDAATGKRTVAVVLGQNGSLWLALSIAVVTVALSIWQANYEIAITAFLTIFGILRLIVSFDRQWMMMTVKIPILLLSLFAAAHFPLYSVILLLTIILTRVYYKRRFAIIYPKPG